MTMYKFIKRFEVRNYKDIENIVSDCDILLNMEKRRIYV